MTPLHLAAVSDDYVDIVHVLLRGGADVNARTVKILFNSFGLCY